MTWRQSDWLIKYTAVGRAGYMGKRPAERDSFDRNMGSIQREDSAVYEKNRQPWKRDSNE